MKIAGAWSGHDCSYFIMEDGQPVRHDEYERFIREKEPAGDSLAFLMKHYPDYQDIRASCYLFTFIKANSLSGVI